MQYLKQTVVALSVLLVGIGCSENRTQRDLTDEAIQLNNSSSTHENKSLLHEGAINPKTQYLKNGDTEVSHKTQETKKIVVLGNNDDRLKRLILDRDTVIRENLELKKVNLDWKKQQATLISTIEDLKKDEGKTNLSTKEKIAASAAALLAAQQLTANKNTDIEKLIKERDEAIKVTLEMEKANAKLKTEISESITQSDEKQKSWQETSEKEKNLLEEQKREIDKLTNDLTHMSDSIKSEQEAKQTAIDELAELKDKLSASTAELSNEKHLISDKDGEINTLKHDKDEAIKITLEMKKENQELLDRLSQLEKEQDESKSSSKGKIAAAATALLAAQQLTANRDDDIAELTKQRDEAIKVTLEMKKSNEEFETTKSDLSSKIEQLTKEKDDMNKKCEEFEAEKLSLNEKVEALTEEKTQSESTSKEKISKLADLLSDAEKSTVEKDTKIDKLTKERDAAIQLAMGIKKELVQKGIDSENSKKLVLKNIVDTFKVSKVEFKTGSAILTNKSKLLLDEVATIMQEHKEYKYKIQGHTDSKGRKEINLKLSQARAESVKKYLISKDVNDSLLSAEGFGSSSPIADNSTEKGRVLNRRVVFEIVN